MCAERRMTAAMTRKSFGSDNHSKTHPAIMRAIADANVGDAVAYGADPWTRRATTELKRLAGAEGEVYLVLNGSGANVFGLGLLLGRHEAVICAESAHINTDECGASERILGTKLLTVPAPGGKLTPELIAGRLTGRGDEHFAQPGVVAITQSTEVGTCYSLAELRKIRDFCSANGLRIYLDGARLANAAAYLGCTLAELAEHADVLSFGGTKNGAMGAEALIVMRPGDAQAAHAAVLQDALPRRAVRRAARGRSLAQERYARELHGRPAGGWPRGDTRSRGRVPGRGGRGLRPAGP
jgi:threonine aldolase